jgi:hypothetical protein
MVGTMNGEPVRSFPRRGPWRSGLAAACVAVAFTIMLGQCGRAEDDWIVDDAELTALESAAAHMRNAFNVQSLQAVFDANILGLFGPVQAQQQGRFGGRRGGQVQVVVGGNGGVVPVAVNGHQSQAAPAADASGESPVSIGLKRSVEPQLTRLERDCDLSAEQHRLLQLALEADIRRVAEDIERDRRKYVGATANLGDQAGQQKVQQMHQDIQRCRQAIQRFDQGTDGLFWKARGSVLTAPQRAKADAEAEARLASRWKAVVNVALSRWDDLLGLDRQQFDELERMLLENRPPLRVNGGTVPGLVGGSRLFQSSAWVVGLALADIGEQRIRKVVTDRQWAVLSFVAQSGRQMRSNLEQQGLLETAKR